MEVLACNVRASPVIQGITLPGLSTPLPVLSLYANDVSVIVSSDGAMEEVFFIRMLVLRKGRVKMKFK